MLSNLIHIDPLKVETLFKHSSDNAKISKSFFIKTIQVDLRGLLCMSTFSQQQLLRRQHLRKQDNNEQKDHKDGGEKVSYLRCDGMMMPPMSLLCQPLGISSDLRDLFK